VNAAPKGLIADDLIKVSGQWIHPLEVERCLAEHPAVGQCAVLGVEDANRRMRLRKSARAREMLWVQTPRAGCRSS
jgi:acyl-coenzyme A synthetase/AMP-(fatty) acid ligase